MAAPTVIDVGEDDFQARVVEASRTTPVVVDFWAGWCRPCLVLSPILERLAEEHGGGFVLAKVDVDANQRLAAEFGVQGIPAVKAFSGGRVVSEFVGAQPEPMVRRFIDGLVPDQADDLAASVTADTEPKEAERTLRQALEMRPGHPGASAKLASVLLDRGDLEDAEAVLAAAGPSPEISSARAELDLRRAAGADGDLGAAARAALSGDARVALERAMASLTDGGDRERARELILRLFEMLGDDHPLTREFRPRLASSLF